MQHRNRAGRLRLGEGSKDTTTHNPVFEASGTHTTGNSTNVHIFVLSSFLFKNFYSDLCELIN
jgi:hypothetical protein